MVGAQMFSRPVCGVDAAVRAPAIPSGGGAAAEAVVPPMSLPSRVVVYYFHGNYRCPTCTRIEKLSREAVESSYAGELKSGALAFQSVNVERPDTEHFVQDYGLYTKALVLSLVKDGKEVRYKNLDKVWEYVRDRDRFHAYVQGEVAQFLEGLK